MKILELHFKNLNSLYDEWRIDFTHPDYAANGIFALIGPTGAGKSTVLDAICLALYGATPRLGKITQSTNEIMSRQTGECYAEVLFATRDGQYRVHWQQRRARKQVDGALQAPIHEIFDGKDAQLIENKRSLVAGVIEAKTGMDFERFTRAILLAQGGFDTFLKADVEQKSTILEQITGTEIYSAISIKVFERQREEKQQLALLQAKAQGITLLSKEAEQALREQQATLAEKLNQHNAQLHTFNKELQWLNELDKVAQSLSKLADEKAILEKKQTVFAPAKARLERAKLASSMEAVYVAYEQCRRQQEKDATALQSLQATLPELERTLNTVQQSLSEQKAVLANSKQTLADKQQILKAVRALDVTLEQDELSLAQLEQDMAKQSALIAQHEKEIATLKQNQLTFSQTMASIVQYEQTHLQDANLLSEHDLITSLYEDWQARLAEIDAAQRAYDDKVQAFDKQQAQRISDEVLNQSQQALAQVEKALKKKITQKEALLAGQTLTDYREQIAQLQTQAQQLVLIANMAEQRQLLSDGKPCPLCGAREHPYAERVDLSDQSNIEHEMQTLQTKVERIETLSDEINQLQSERYAAERTYDQLVAQRDQQQKELNYLTDYLREQQALLAQNQQKADDKAQTLAAKMAKYGLGVNQSDILVLGQRLTRWQKNTADKQRLTQEIDDVIQLLQRLTDKKALYDETLAQYKNTFTHQQKRYQDKQKERRALLGEQSPDEVEQRLQDALEQAQAAYDVQLQREQASVQALKHAEQQIKDKQQQLQDNQSVMAKKEQEFTRKLALKSFTSEADFLQARSPEAELDALIEQAQVLNDEHARINAQQQHQQTQLSILQAQALTNQTHAQIEQQLATLTAEIEEINANLHQKTFQLESNDKAKQALTSHQQEIEKQRQECQRWDGLNELIGSSDGKKYRSFAQGLTFEVMIGHANEQLAKMTDRYRLLRDTHEPLSLNVIDFYQASNIRTIKNLSGGESFIISLALALGLSTMASQSVQIDSLFLDEGFGTLDEHALDTALNMLSELNQDGKLIGIISHVGALKERIATQIKVTPISNGKSKLQGPGCEQINSSAG